MAYGRSNDDVIKGQGRDLNIVKTRYFENGSR